MVDDNQDDFKEGAPTADAPTADAPPDGAADAGAETTPEAATEAPTEPINMEEVGPENLDVDGDGVGDLLTVDDQAEPMRSARDLEAVYDIPVQLQAVLGKASMQVSQLLKLGRGAVVELDRKVGEAIDIYVNNRLVARGEVVVVEERLGITMTEIIKSDRVQ